MFTYLHTYSSKKEEIRDIIGLEEDGKQHFDEGFLHVIYIGLTPSVSSESFFFCLSHFIQY